MARGVEGRGKVDGDDRVPFFGREVLDRRDMLDAGIVDEDVGPAKLIGAALHHPLDRLRIGHIGAVVDRADLLTFAGDVGRVAETVDHQPGAFGGKRLGDGEANARRRTRDQRDFAFKDHATLPCRATRGGRGQLQPSGKLAH